MPLHVPAPPPSASQIAELSAAEVWAFKQRLLTSLATPDHIVKFLGKGTGTEVPDDKSLYDLLGLERLDIMQHEIGFSSLAALDPITAVPPPDQDTTELEITVTLPEGAHIVRAYLIALITALNATANAHTIDVDVKGRVAAGSWRTYFSEDNCFGVIPLVGATAYLTAVQDVGPTAPVVADRIVTDDNVPGTFGFKCTIVQDSANEVRYTTQYVLIVAYRMGA